MRVLTVASRIPRLAAPGCGTLVLDRVKAMRCAGAEVRIIAPAPWPCRAADRGEDEELPRRVVRYFRVPGIGTRFAASACARAIRGLLADEISAFKPDVIDAHDLYPDGVAVLLAARKSGVPVAVTAHGRDVLVTARLPAIHEKLEDTLPGAAVVIAVTADLAEDLRSRGVFRRDIEIIEDGVDLTHFRPGSREKARSELGLGADGHHLVCAGNLFAASTVKLLLASMVGGDAPCPPTVHFLGDGPARRRLERLSRVMGLAKRAVFHGRVGRERVALFLRAANGAVALGRDTTAVQAVREARACRIPVLAADIPAMRDRVFPFRQGLLARFDLLGVRRGVAKLLELDWDISEGEPRGWESVGAEILACFGRVV